MLFQNQNWIAMIDTLGLRLIYGGGGTDLITVVSPLLENIYGCCNMQGKEYVSGWLDGLKVTVRPVSLHINGGSFCKWCIGDNYRTLTRRDIQTGIEKLSDILHLSMKEADVTRLDIGQNLIMKYPVMEYLNHLGAKKNYKRLEEPNGLYYDKKGVRLCFYDKNQERKDKRQSGDIPLMYAGRNVLRYEIRFTSRIARHFDREFVVAADLYEQNFYVQMVRHWADGYKSIQKINEIVPNFDCIKTKTDFNRFGGALLVERFGGQSQMLDFLSDAQKRGKLTARQAYDLRKSVNDVCSVRESLVVESDSIKELDRKIMQAAMYYR